MHVISLPSVTVHYNGNHNTQASGYGTSHLSHMIPYVGHMLIHTDHMINDMGHMINHIGHMIHHTISRPLVPDTALTVMIKATPTPPRPGMPLTLSCLADKTAGLTNPTTITWSHDMSPDSVLYFSKLNASHAGIYQCTAALASPARAEPLIHTAQYQLEFDSEWVWSMYSGTPLIWTLLGQKKVS